MNVGVFQHIKICDFNYTISPDYEAIVINDDNAELFIIPGKMVDTIPLDGLEDIINRTTSDFCYEELVYPDLDYYELYSLVNGKA